MNKYFYYNYKDSFDWSDEQFKVVLNDHLELIDILGFLANTMFEKKIKDIPYKYYSETLAFKYIYQSLNLNSLLKGTSFSSKIFGVNNVLFDISSSYIMQRSLYETYLTFFYLYIQPQNEEESKCKWLIYKIAGLNSRQDFKSDYIDYKPKIEKERREIEESIAELKTNIYFLSLQKNKQNEILNNKQAKIVGWKSLFSTSDLKNNMFIKSWRLYSNYAHSEYISLIQFKEYKQYNPKFIDAKHSIAFISLVLSAIFITNMRKLYKEIEDNFQKLSNEQIECIKIFDGIGRKLD